MEKRSNGQSDIYSKYAEIDNTLKTIDKKIREGSKVGYNKVSVMAEQFSPKNQDAEIKQQKSVNTANSKRVTKLLIGFLTVWFNKHTRVFRIRSILCKNFLEHLVTICSNITHAWSSTIFQKKRECFLHKLCLQNVKPTIVLPAQGGSEICHFCKKRVYLMERLSAEGKYFHRSCFRCEYCSILLRIGKYTFSSLSKCDCQEWKKFLQDNLSLTFLWQNI